MSFSAGVGNGTITVTASARCPWSATSNVSWISITSVSNGEGNGQVNLTVAANTSPSSRTGTLTVAQQTMTLTQQGAAGGGSTPVRPEIIGNYTLEVRAAAHCNWPVQTHRFPVTFTYQGLSGGLHSSYVFWTPNSPNTSTLRVQLGYAYSPPGGSGGTVVTGDGFQGIPSANDYRVWMEVNVQGGAPTRGTDGRPEILNAVLSGELDLIRERDWNCTGTNVGTMSVIVR